jgi:hypothetical protein
VSVYFGTPISEVLRETLDSNSPLRNIETFFLPVLLGLCVYFARRISFFIVIAGSFYLVTKNVFIFVAMNQSDPVVPLVLMNLFFVFVIVYLLRRSTRMIYFNERMRWWETDPRYVVNLPASLTRLGASPKSVKIANIAVGGAAVATEESGFIPHEMIHIEFQHEGESFKLTAGVVWEKPPGSGEHLIGIHWVEDLLKKDRKRVIHLMRALRAKGVQETRASSSGWKNLLGWLKRS